MTDSSPAQDNGLQASAYVPLADIDPAVRDTLLAALRRARIAAYVAPAASVESPPRLRLYVATTERSDAQAVIAVAARSVVPDGAAASRPDLLAGVDPRAEFDALVGDWHVDTVKAVRAAERDLSREDAEWRMRLQLPPAGADANAEDEHYVPPPPPPLPRLAGATVLALVVTVISIVVLGFGRALGLPGDLAFLAGVAGILIGAGLLVMRLRERPPDEDDDGAVI